MTALTAPRRTDERSGNYREPGMKAATKIWQGSMAALDATGFVVPASTSTTLKVIGRAEDTVDNTAGISGAVNARVKAGIFRFANSAAGDLIAITDINADCYAVDDQTVAKTNGGATRSKAGTIFDVDALGVWVKFA